MKSLFLISTLILSGIGTAFGQETTATEDPDALFFHMDTVVSNLVSNDKRWVSFLKGKNLLGGVYYLKKGHEDRQQPHDTDEVYYVLQGKAKFVAGGKTTEVSKGSVLFVKANVAHKFEAIEEDLQLLVFFDQ